MALRLTFRRTILLFILLVSLQAFLFHLYFNYITFDDNVVKHPRIVGSTTSRHKLNFTCDINDNQAIYALQRMKTAKCKQKCADVYCETIRNKPWPDRLTSRCNHYDDNQKGQLQICYSFNESMLSLFPPKKSKIFTNQTFDCFDLCLQFDFQFAGTYLDHCICHNSLDIFNSENISTIHCDHCSSLNHQCANTLFIYKTGLTKTPFYFPKEIPESVDSKPRIVFLLLVNGRSLLQIHRLLRNIWSRNHYYYIHVDLRHRYLYEELLMLERSFTNIKLARHRFASIWGGSSLLSTVLSCISDVLEQWHDWDFILNLSETDFPIKPITDLERYLAAHKHKNFIKSHGKNAYDFTQMQAANKIFLECENHMWRIANRELIRGIVWDGGSDWVILSRNFSKYVTDGDDPLLNGLKAYFQYSLLPAESFFHVVLRNSEYCSTIVNNNLRVTNWNRKKGCKCQHKNIVDWCGCSPNAFTTKDTTRLAATQSRPFFFARKFEHQIDSDIIDFVEQSLLLNGLPLLDESVYMENVYSAKHDSSSALSKAKLGFYRAQSEKVKRFLAEHCYAENDEPIEKLNLQLEESNIYFRSNKFAGILLKFSGFGAAGIVSKFETILERSQEDVILVQSGLKPKLKSIKVCTKFDLKEEMFRDFECLLDQSTPVEVLHEWDLFFGHYSLTFVFLEPPNNRVAAQYALTINNTKSDEHSIKQLFSLPFGPIVSGIWKLLVINQNEVIGAARFVVARSETGEVPSRPYNSTTEHLRETIESFISQHFEFFNNKHQDQWHVQQVCFESDQFQCGQRSRVMPCGETNWSSASVGSRYLLVGG